MTTGGATTTLTLDVVRNHLGIERPNEAAAVLRGMSSRQIDLFVAAVRSSLDGTPRSLPEGQFYYPGGWAGEAWEWPQMRDDSLALLLYYPNLVLHDPLAGFTFQDWAAIPPWRSLETMIGAMGGAAEVVPVIGPPTVQARSFDAVRHDRAQVNAQLTAKVEALLQLAPMIDAGIVALVDQWRTMAANTHQLATALRHDTRDSGLQGWLTERALKDPESQPLSWDDIRGLDVTVPSGFTRRGGMWRHQTRLLYMEKSLILASSSGAAYAPDARGDLDLIRYRGSSLAAIERMDGDFMRSVRGALLPGMTVTPELVIKMRLNDGDFAEWRKRLRNVRTGSIGAEGADLELFIKDQLLPAAQRVSRAASTLRDLARHAGPPLTVELVAWKFVGAPFGWPAVTTTVVDRFFNALMPSNRGGAEGIMSAIMTSRHKQQRD